MSANFLLLQCYKCEDVRQIAWPFRNVLKLYCDCCNKCDRQFKLSKSRRQKELMELPPRELIRRHTDLPNQMYFKENGEVFYFSFQHHGNNTFGWHHLKKTELKFPLLLVNYEMRFRRRRLSLITGIMLLKELEVFLNQPDFAW